MSYETLIRHKNDVFMKVKFQIFLNVITMFIKIFLKDEQVDASMVPFLSDVQKSQLLETNCENLSRFLISENFCVVYKGSWWGLDKNWASCSLKGS